MRELKLRKLRFYTKDDKDLIEYQTGTCRAAKSLVYVYEHTGTEEDALRDFMRLDSFVMAATGDSFLALPLKGICKVQKSIEKLLCRVEKGHVTPLEDYCKLCGNRIKKLLSGCDPCDGLKMLPQLHPMYTIDVTGTIETVEHHKDKRSQQSKKYQSPVGQVSSLIAA